MRPRAQHVAARAEDWFHRHLGRRLQGRGWTPLVTASTGYADHDGVHVFVRVLLGPPPSRGSSPARRRWPRRAQPPRGWRSLVTFPAAGTPVTIAVAGRSHELIAERGGYVHAELPMALEPGWHEVAVSVATREPVACRVRAVDPHAVHGVVSDIDDTILVTSVPRPLLAAWNTFVLREHARRPVPGMAELLRGIAGEDGFVAYLSTGAWNFAPHLERFMAEHGFPAGPLLLTDWGPTEGGWFRSGEAHKRQMLERLRHEHPSTRWILVGDDGQRDPQIYAGFVAEHPDAVRAVAIRRLSAAHQVLASGTPTAGDPGPVMAPASPTAPGSPDTAPAEVPWVTGADGFELMAALRYTAAVRIDEVAP